MPVWGWPREAGEHSSLLPVLLFLTHLGARNGLEKRASDERTVDKQPAETHLNSWIGKLHSTLQTPSSTAEAAGVSFQ